MFRNKNLAAGGMLLLLAAPSHAMSVREGNRLEENGEKLSLIGRSLALFASPKAPVAVPAPQPAVTVPVVTAPAVTAPTVPAPAPVVAQPAVAAPAAVEPAPVVAPPAPVVTVPAAPAVVLPEPVVASPVAPVEPGVVETIVGVAEAVVETVKETVAELAAGAAETAAAVADSVTQAVTDAVAAVVETAQPASNISSTPSLQVKVAGTPGTGTEAPAPAPAPDPAPKPVEPEAAPAAATALPTAQVFSVSTRAELSAALTAAQKLAGAEIRLQPGDYGALTWTGKAYPLGRVRIVAATTQRPVFSSINLARSKGMIVSGIRVKGLAAATSPLVSLNSTQDIVFAGNIVTGFANNQDPWDDSVTAVHVRYATSVTVSGNLFEDLKTTFYTQQSTNIVFDSNELRHVREGVNVAATTNLDISRNYFHSFSPRFDRNEHPDSVQFWTTGEKAGSRNVKLTENVMLHGGCGAIQGIFIRSETEGKNVAQVRHANFTIRNNVYYGSALHGITVSSVDGALIEGNAVIASPYAESAVSRAKAQAQDIRCSGALTPVIRPNNGTSAHVIRRNIVHAIHSNEGSVSDNVIVGAAGVSFTQVLAARPTGEKPALSAFVTRNPSDARTRQIGILATFPYGATMTPSAALTRALSLHKL